MICGKFSTIIIVLKSYLVTLLQLRCPGSTYGSDLDQPLPAIYAAFHGQTLQFSSRPFYFSHGAEGFPLFACSMNKKVADKLKNVLILNRWSSDYFEFWWRKQSLGDHIRLLRFHKIESLLFHRVSNRAMLNWNSSLNEDKFPIPNFQSSCVSSFDTVPKNGGKPNTHKGQHERR